MIDLPFVVVDFEVSILSIQSVKVEKKSSTLEYTMKIQSNKKRFIKN